MTDVTGNPEEERRTEFYQAPWVPEAVSRYVFSKVTCLIMSFHLCLCDSFYMQWCGCCFRCSRGDMSWSRSSVSDSLRAARMSKLVSKHAAFFKSSSQEGCVVYESGSVIVSAALESEHTHTHTHVHLHTHCIHTWFSYLSLLRLDIAMSCENDVWLNGAACVITGGRHAFLGPVCGRSLNVCLMTRGFTIQRNTTA